MLRDTSPETVIKESSSVEFDPDFPQMPDRFGGTSATASFIIRHLTGKSIPPTTIDIAVDRKPGMAVAGPSISHYLLKQGLDVVFFNPPKSEIDISFDALPDDITFTQYLDWYEQAFNVKTKPDDYGIHEAYFYDHVLPRKNSPSPSESMPPEQVQSKEYDQLSFEEVTDMIGRGGYLYIEVPNDSGTCHVVCIYRMVHDTGESTDFVFLPNLEGSLNYPYTHELHDWVFSENPSFGMWSKNEKSK